MAVRSTMAPLIARVRLLINDPPGISQVFEDQDLQDVMDESRVDYRNAVLTPSPTFSGSTLTYFDYYHPLGGWEDAPILKQYLTVIVSPSVSENIVGHWQFAASTYPPVYISGSLHDVYRASADLLERWAARMTLAYDFSSDGQSFRRSQVVPTLLSLANSYRHKQRPVMIEATRGDMTAGSAHSVSLAPTDLDYYAQG